MDMSFCRICLNCNVKMYAIYNPELKLVFERLTNIKIDSDSHILCCYICHKKLKNSHEFMKKALRSNDILTELLHHGIELSQQTISLKCSQNDEFTSSVTENTILVGICVKDEISDKDFDAKQNIDVDETNQEFGIKYEFNAVDNFDTDSEDDVPLKDIKREGVRDNENNKLVTDRRKNNLQDFDSQEIILSIEEQMQALLKRSESSNYLNSPYRCDLCYKGFVYEQAYFNHKLKHDASSGGHECRVCRMRYRSPRLLRLHSVAAHEKLYKCNKCDAISHTLNQARFHEKWHKGHTYECQLCGMKFRKPTSLLTHKRKNHPTEYICNVCGECFVGKHGLMTHKSKTHKTNDTVEATAESYCSECDIQFLTIEAWKKHIICSLKHNLDSSLRCRICDIKFSSRDSFSTHMKEHKKSLWPHHTPPKNVLKNKLPCEQCGANFANGSKLQAHIKRVHLGLKYNKNIICEVCGKKCTSAATLRYHLRSHTGERPHGCAACGKRFSDTNQLRIHARTHTGDRPYACALCQKRFTQKTALTRHYRVHTGAKPYACQYCSKTFSQSNSMKLHVKTMHMRIEKVMAPKKLESTDIQQEKTVHK